MESENKEKISDNRCQQFDLFRSYSRDYTNYFPNQSWNNSIRICLNINDSNKFRETLQHRGLQLINYDKNRIIAEASSCLPYYSQVPHKDGRFG